MAVAVPKLWPGETAVCIASGPSLNAEDVEYVKGKARTIVINGSYVLAPWADVLYSADANPFRWYWEHGPKGYERIAMRDFRGLKFSLTKRSAQWSGVQVLKQGCEDGLSLDPTRLCLGMNSGYQAINLAVLLGAVRILLLGYDMNVAKDGTEYWHAQHPHKKRSPYKSFRRLFPGIVAPLKKAGVDVINCSRETALECFPRMSLREALPMMQESAA
jgi:hypothetical protein